MELVQLDGRPRPVWGRRPRVNGGRRRPRGWMGQFTLLPVVSRASYPPTAPKPPLPNPSIDDFPDVIFDAPELTGYEVDQEAVGKIVGHFNLIGRFRLVLLARAAVLTNSSEYRKKTKAIWGEHDRMLALAERAREKFQEDYGYEAPIVPANFYLKF